jgi:hypothetical protein
MRARGNHLRSRWRDNVATLRDVDVMVQEEGCRREVDGNRPIGVRLGGHVMVPRP